MFDQLTDTELRGLHDMAGRATRDNMALRGYDDELTSELSSFWSALSREIYRRPFVDPWAGQTDGMWYGGRG